jgi:NADH-quinone oxidoreductase subunit A
VDALAPVVTPAGVEASFDLTTWLPVFMLLLVCIAFAVGSLVTSHLVGPHKNTAVKLMVYESGMDPIGDAHQQFDVKFYLIAILFLVFDVELLFLYPWATIAYPAVGGADWAGSAWRAAFRWTVFGEILVFVATLVVAYVYAWRKGVFRWRQ